jgi:nitrile hydratase
MNTIHDMGGMRGLGELDYQETEPVFHEPWEGRVNAMMIALRLFGGFRAHMESLPAADYLRMGYYERWLHSLQKQVVAYGLVTEEELERGKAAPGSNRGTPALSVERARDVLFETFRSELDTEVTPRFEVGDQVRGRNIHPTGHTRMPRYTRGRTGVVERDRGVFALPDSQESGGDPRPQHVYLVRFSARELWGDRAAPNDSLYIDMWEDYLEPR